MKFLIFSTIENNEYGYTNDSDYMQNAYNILNDRNYKITQIYDNKHKNYKYYIEVDSVEKLVAISDLLPSNDGIIIKDSTIEIYNGYREL